MKNLLAMALGLVLIAGCSEMNLKQFEGSEPKLVMEEYFAGRTWAWGVFEDRFGQLRRQFRADLQGRWDGEVLVLEENFFYRDGEEDQRIWHIRPEGPDRYSGTAGDVIGTAEGRIAGNALHWQYQMELPVGERRWKVHFDDWMWLQPGGVLINRATVSKWGVTLGTVTVFFSKQAPES